MRPIRQTTEPRVTNLSLVSCLSVLSDFLAGFLSSAEAGVIRPNRSSRPSHRVASRMASPDSANSGGGAHFTGSDTMTTMSAFLGSLLSAASLSLLLDRSEEHTSELQSRQNFLCRL